MQIRKELVHNVSLVNLRVTTPSYFAVNGNFSKKLTHTLYIFHSPTNALFIKLGKV